MPQSTKNDIINQFSSKITLHLSTQSCKFNILCIKVKINLKDLKKLCQRNCFILKVQFKIVFQIKLIFKPARK